MASTAHIRVYLDDCVPEYMSGIFRCGSVVSEDKDGNDLQDHQEIVDNAEFHSEKELIEHVAERLGVTDDMISVES